MKKEPTQTMTIRVPISLHLQLQILATKDSRTVNSLVNKILIEYVDKVKKQGVGICPLPVVLFINLLCRINNRIYHFTYNSHINIVI